MSAVAKMSPKPSLMSSLSGRAPLLQVPFTYIEYDSNARIWPGVRQAYELVDRYQLVNSYGLFRRMTGVSGRPEVVIEGSYDAVSWTVSGRLCVTTALHISSSKSQRTVMWQSDPNHMEIFFLQEIEFMYKPGNLSAPPPVLIPHQPRLDWQMWFAALGTHTQAPWFSSLMYRLLQGKRDGTRVVLVVGPSLHPVTSHRSYFYIYRCLV